MSRILRRLLIGSELLRQRLQSRIELHKGVLDCRMVFMTLPARRLGIGLGGFCAFVEAVHEGLVFMAGDTCLRTY